MGLLVTLFGLLFMGLGLAGILFARSFVAWIRSQPQKRLYVMAVGARLAMGAVFLLAAHDTRYPWAVRVFGIIALAAAAVLGVMGPQRLERMVQWWLGLLEGRMFLMRAGMACAALLGAFFVYAGI